MTNSNNRPIYRHAKPHTAQRAILSDNTRFRVVSCGRRFGKTELAKIAVAHRMIHAGQRVWYASPTYTNSKLVFESFVGDFDPDAVFVNRSDFTVRIKSTGGYVRFVSLHNADNLRGEGLDFIVVDEAAFVKQGVWDKVLAPMLLTTEGGALLISSPNGRNWFWDKFQWGQDPTRPQWTAYQHPSWNNPAVSQADIAEYRRTYPEAVFKQEYEAAFIDSDGAVFRNIHACVYDAEPTYNDVVVGVDLGRVNDYTVFTAIDKATNAVVAIDRFHDVDMLIQANRLLAFMDKVQARRVLIEGNFENTFISHMRTQTHIPIEEFRTTSQSKAQIISGLVLAFEQASVTIPNNPTLVGELLAFKAERLTHTIRYSAPDGLHDDMVMSLAIAWYGASGISVVGSLGAVTV